MDKVSDISTVLSIVADIRNKRQGFITNFYLDEKKHLFWIQNGIMFYEYDDGCLFLFKKNNSFWNLYYVSTSIEWLTDKLAKLIEDNSDDCFVIDIIERNNQINSTWKQLCHSGFYKAGEFVRMMRIGKSDVFNPVENVVFADESDVRLIGSLIQEHFNPLLEQLPLSDELYTYSNNHQILKYVENDEILGFIVFEQNPSTIHLRYWLVRPEYRNKKVGSKLLRQFLFVGRDTHRQILWVSQDNENAIQKYLHYGFEKDNMFDFIMTNK